MEEELIDNLILSEGQEMIDSISVCYLSDRKKEKSHLIPGEGSYNLPKITKTLKKHNYT